MIQVDILTVALDAFFQHMEAANQLDWLLDPEMTEEDFYRIRNLRNVELQTAQQYLTVVAAVV